MRKNWFIIFLLFSFLQLNVFAQGTETLRMVAQAFSLSVQKDYFIITSEQGQDSFKLKPKPANERNYALENPADKATIERILSLDQEEIKAKWSNAFRGLDVVDIVINKTAASTGGTLKLMPEEVGGQSIDALQPTVQTEKDSAINWMQVAIGILIGVVAGAAIAAAFRKPAQRIPAPVITEEESENFEETVKPFAQDPKKITDKAKEQIAKLKAEKKALTSEMKNLKSNMNQLEQTVKASQQFNQVYYAQAYKEIIEPANAALEKGDEAKASALLLQALAQFSSKARNELNLKQAYDIFNLNILTQQAVQEKDVQIINADTPLDKIPANIKNVLRWMEKNGAHSLAKTAFWGYKINR